MNNFWMFLSSCVWRRKKKTKAKKRREPSLLRTVTVWSPVTQTKFSHAFLYSQNLQLMMMSSSQGTSKLPSLFLTLFSKDYFLSQGSGECSFCHLFTTFGGSEVLV